MMFKEKKICLNFFLKLNKIINVINVVYVQNNINKLL